MFVYLTTCLSSGKKYIGKYEGPESNDYLGSGKLLKRAIAKHGKDNFSRIILERYSTVRECREGEAKWIELLNAVRSPLFYNIAAGGEGGNTYGGLSKSERVELKAKLKKRTKRASPAGTVSYLDLRTGDSGVCLVSEFKKDTLKVGAKAKYIYITPIGRYSSLLKAHIDIKIDMDSLRRRCIDSSKIITRVMIAASDHRLKKHDELYIGRTFKEAGYGVYSISEILRGDSINLQSLNIKK